MFCYALIIKLCKQGRFFSDHFQPLPSKPTVEPVVQPKLRARPPSPSVRGRLTPTRDFDSKSHNGRGDVRCDYSFCKTFMRVVQRSLQLIDVESEDKLTGEISAESLTLIFHFLLC